MLALRRAVSVRPLVRSYTIIPSMPEQSVTPKQAQQDYNPVHALYNNENQSVGDHLVQPGQTYRSLSTDDNATFSPTFNSVFDE